MRRILRSKGTCEFEAASPGMIGPDVFSAAARAGQSGRCPAGSSALSSPARVVGLPSPTLREGARAELAVIDFERSFVIDPARMRSKSHNTPFLGRKIQGAVALTMADGAIIFEATEST